MGASAFESGDCTYEVISATEATCRLARAGASTGSALMIPATVSDGTTSYNVTEIGSNAFAECADVLTSLALAASPTPIKFAHNALAGIEITEFQMGRDFTSAVNDEPFDGMKSLTRLIVGQGVTRIPNFAFHGCSFTSLSLPSTVTSIGVAAFDNSALSQLTFDAGSMLESIALEAFNGSKLTTVTLPQSLKYIGDEAFAATSIRSMYIPANVERIGNNAFAGCKSLSTLLIDPANTHFATENNLLYTADYHTLLQVAGAYRFITVNSATKEIAPYAFNGCIAHTIILPSGLKKIDEYAFFRCAELTSLELPDGLEVISRGAFSYCSSLNEITLPALYRIPDELFMASGITSVKFAGAVIKVGSKAFSACPNLEGIDLPNSVDEIENGAFEQCRALIRVTLPYYTLKTIGDNAFHECTRLNDITLPYSLVSIGDNAFSGCTSIDNVVFYGQVKHIGAGAYAGVTLTNVSCDGATPPEIDITTFSNKTYSKGQLLVPPGSIADYKSATGWKFFSIITKSDTLGAVGQASVDSSDTVTVYNISGLLLYRGKRGLMPRYPPASTSSTALK
ncbi:MAG: leucine-rich repeat domain-containing protein [Muribaculaceae bacterium]|nr:leucine-rich repeat domain-containing protein [Muribaculaceae bacterium]